MRLELLVSPVGGAVLELITVDFEDESWRAGIGACGRDLDAKHGSFLRHDLELVLGRDDLEDKARVLDDDAPDADAAGAAAAGDLEQGAMEVGGAELAGGGLAAGVQVAGEELAHVAQPEGVQRLEHGVLLAVAGQVV